MTALLLPGALEERVSEKSGCSDGVLFLHTSGGAKSFPAPSSQQRVASGGRSKVLSISFGPSVYPRLRSFVLYFPEGVVSDVGSLGEGTGWAVATLTSDRPPKVPLKQGRSLMDWIRLTKSGKDLTGLKGRLIEVTEEELKKHNKKDDCWICIRGLVYNVSPYMEYHPGGEDELMKAAGSDGTDLFDQYPALVKSRDAVFKHYILFCLPAALDEVMITFSGPAILVLS
ncbi:hypothetical protein PANDA_014737 [Ailuropoda melanoleuca]|uniref:Cytochrome b5 heme-binding domain-containing protein n=1 Tax=Ailuropoda melanoleuca TaxID=9646 RepID=D2HRU1_AILME|nr:hypothetical protein PANDA_014737 [Ailuropoda melanoleuca]